jgi:hypothetical protein
MSEDRLDQALNEMKNESVPEEEAAAARARVWQKLAGADSVLCTEFRASLQEYAAGGLESSRRLLLEDHLSRCTACRRAMAELHGMRKVEPIAAVRRGALPVWSRWAIAAGVAAMALYLGRGPLDTALAPSGPRATVVNVAGSLYKLPQGALAVGATLADGEVVRTGYGARAVLRLADGSLVEANERTELSVIAAWSGQSIRLERGDIIVRAAKQRRGHLRVMTRDSVASVKGTVFAVSTGLAGSLVSVVEGSVQVAQPGGERLLSPGQLAASSTTLEGVPVRQTIAWSQDAEKYYAVLAELASIGKTVAERATPAPRTQSKLLSYVPAGTFLYLAAPNIGDAIQQTVTLIEQRAQENATLREWWASADKEKIKLLIGKVQSISSLIGDEVVFVLLRRPLDTKEIPALLAEVQPGRQDALQQSLAQVFSGADVPYRVSGGLLVISDTPAHLGTVLAGLGQAAGGPFATEIATHYQGGVGLLFAFDVASASVLRTAGAAQSAAMGVNKLKYIFFEQRSVQGNDELRAAAVFDGPRTGVASWLASPGPAGSAEYISNDAVLAVSAATRNPREAFEEFAGLVGKVDSRFSQGLAQMESQTGVSLANDIAAALGTDFTFAIERPTIPIPGWVAALEVTQPSLIDSAIRRFAAAVNAKLAQVGMPAAVAVEEQVVNGRTWMTLRPSPGVALAWTYDRGYMILSTDRDLVSQAIATRDSGLFLVRSEKFRAQLPAATGLHQSGFFWLNTQGPLADAAGLLGSGPLKALLESREPVIVVVNGDAERIQASSRTRLMSMLFTTMLAGGPKRIASPPR